MNRVLYQLSYAAMGWSQIPALPKSALSLYTGDFVLSSKKFNFLGRIYSKGGFHGFFAKMHSVLSGWKCLFYSGAIMAGPQPRQYVPAGRHLFSADRKLSRLLRRVPLAIQLILSAGLITALELLTGQIVNRNHQIWDYRRMPCNYHGQVCLHYSMLWVPISLMAILLYNAADRTLRHKL